MLAVCLIAGAIGYWSAVGAGIATTTADNPESLVLNEGSPETQISPGRSAGVAALATNPNPYEVRISSISLDAGRGTGGFEVDPGHAGCDPAVLSFSPQNNGGGGWTVPAMEGSTPGSLVIEMPDALAMSSSAADACQGAALTVYLETGS